MVVDYLKRIREAKTRHEAADFIRAHIVQYVAGPVGKTLSDKERITHLEFYEARAQALTQSVVREKKPPWRKWLRDWNFA